jgi:hypothetical protein
MRVKFLLLLCALIGLLTAFASGETAEGGRASGVIGQRDTVEIRFPVTVRFRCRWSAR